MNPFSFKSPLQVFIDLVPGNDDNTLKKDGRNASREGMGTQGEVSVSQEAQARNSDC